MIPTTREQALEIEHKKFRDQYRATTSGDWQTFVIGFNAAWEAKTDEFDKIVIEDLRLALKNLKELHK